MARTTIAYVPTRDGAEHEPATAPEWRGVDVVAVVHDREARRDGLTEALRRLSEGEASTLLIARLDEVAGSSRELVGLLDWLAAADADLIALDVGLDTATRTGAQIVRVLREVERWDREPPPGRPPRGRPGLAHHSPELARQVKALRDDGESLQAIADALNAENVPTPRGGDRWRPSSVQAALGYRRPRPPGPAAPPPPPQAPGPPGRGPRPPAGPPHHRRGAP
ncbi:MAG: recombinase family protein [Solirubrobacteraceae bacterium]